MKSKWHGPATVCMREDDEQGRPRVYWVAHGTSLLRCAGEQIRPIVEEIGQNLSLNFEAARQALQHVTVP